MKLQYSYDRDVDVLYASIGNPRPAICTEPRDGVLIRHDVDTDEVVGFTIINYSRQKKRGHLNNIPYFGKVDIPI